MEEKVKTLYLSRALAKWIFVIYRTKQYNQPNNELQRSFDTQKIEPHIKKSFEQGRPAQTLVDTFLMMDEAPLSQSMAYLS